MGISYVEVLSRATLGQDKRVRMHPGTGGAVHFLFTCGGVIRVGERNLPVTHMNLRRVNPPFGQP